MRGEVKTVEEAQEEAAVTEEEEAREVTPPPETTEGAAAEEERLTMTVGQQGEAEEDLVPETLEILTTVQPVTEGWAPEP